LSWVYKLLATPSKVPKLEVVSSALSPTFQLSWESPLDFYQ